MVFFIPEIILSKQKWRELLLSESYTRHLRALVVDEAHTIKKWCVDVKILYYVSMFYNSS